MKADQPYERDAVPVARRRSVERDYLAALADLVPLDTWRDICLATVEAAKAGDPKAHGWLARYLIGEKPMKLLTLAADETAAFSTDDLVEQERELRRQSRVLSDSFQMLNTGTPGK